MEGADVQEDNCPLNRGGTSGYFAHRRAGERACEHCRRAHRQHINEYRRRTPRKKYRPHLIKCDWCGEQSPVSKSTQRWCSLECRRSHEADVRSSRYAVVPAGPSWPKSDLPRLHPARQESAKVPGLWAKVFVQGPCAWCGTDFCSGATSVGTAPRYCSKRCVRAAGRVGGSRFRVPDRVRQEIYDRDGWKCQLCGKRVGKKYHPSHERAPTLDHIIPQSIGGSDDPSNLQLAHRICNSIKNAKVWEDGEQLRLVG